MKHLVLKILYQNSSDYISGESIAKTLNISRVAVKKHIDSLIKKGYNITSQKKSGYMLNSLNNIFDEYSIKMFLSLYGIDIDIFYYTDIDSTNTQAKNHITSSDEGAVIAAMQNNGKGRKGRTFISAEGGIYLSYYCKPNNITPFDAIKAVITSAVATCDMIKSLNIPCQIKWANDIFYKDKKLCGILCEMVTESEKVNYLIQGIGINAGNILSNDISTIATSLKEITGKEYNRAEICAKLIFELKKCNKLLFEGKFNTLLKKYKADCLTLGKNVTVYGKTEYNALAIDIDENGFLIVKTKDKLNTVLFGDVSVKADN